MKEFVPLFCKNQLKIINPFGTIGIITLWSGISYIERKLAEAGISLDPSETPIAVVGTLYGNGLRELLRNLLYNPQINTLILYGRNRSGSAEELISFFEKGIELVENAAVSYEPLPDGTEPKLARIKGTRRIIDDLIKPEMFEIPPEIIFAGEPQQSGALQKIKQILKNYRPQECKNLKRIMVPLPEMKISWYPSNPRTHTIWAEDPLTAWKDLIHTLYNFGRPVVLKKGPRRELQNMKVVVENPEPVPKDIIEKYGFKHEKLLLYQKEFLSAVLPEDTTYTYGHRMKSYFGFDQIEVVKERLREDPEDRKSYIVLWDPKGDLINLNGKGGRPCLTSLFFRKFDNRLTLTATFRTHNALDAWLVNFYGLMALQKEVAGAVNMPPGAISVISHSISIDEAELDRAALIASEKEFRYRLDPMGYFRISLDSGEIVVEYRVDDITLKIYRSKKAAKLQHEIARDGIVSEISHAIYLGRQLERAEKCLRDGTTFIQD